MLRSWRRSGFNLDSSRRLEAGDRSSLESLLQYIERPPVSLERLTYRDDGMVVYRGKFHPGIGKDHQFVTGVEFLAMLVPHIALRYEVTIRYYGALATSIRKYFGWIGDTKSSPPDVITVDDEDCAFVKTRKRNWARLISKVWLDDPELYPHCGSKMVLVAAISSPAQDDVIERILKSRDDWNPPWLQHRPARGPPQQSELFEEFEESPVSTWDPENENQDAAGDAWLE